jgi:hypothetical protein
MSATELYSPDFRANPIKVERSKRANRRCATMPAGVQPIVRVIFAEIARQNLRYQDVEDFSGVRRASLKSWRRRTRPSWESVQSVLSVLGFGFVPTPALQVLPAELAGEFPALAMKLEKNLPETFNALVDLAAEQKLLAMDATERRAVIEAHHATLRGHSNRRRRPKPHANDNVRQNANVA